MNRNALFGAFALGTAGMWIVANSVETLLLFWLMTALWGANYGVNKAKQMTEG